MFNNNKKWPILILSILLLFSLFMIGCAKNIKKQTADITLQPPKENYDTVSATKGDYVSTFSSRSVELVYDAVAVTSNKKTSRFLEFQVRKYDKVKEGDVIAVLDTQVSTVNVEEKQLAYERCKSEYQVDSADMRADIMKQEQALEQMSEGTNKEIAAIKLDQARARYQQYVLQTERSIAQQNKDINKLEKEVTDNTIIAPFDGIIMDMPSLGKGDEVKTGDTICKMVSEDQICLGVTDRGDLRYNMAVTVTSKWGKTENKYQGRVTLAKNVAPDGKWDSLSYITLEDPKLYLELQNPTVDADGISVKDVLLLDPSVIHNDSNGDYVSLYENNQVTKQSVVVGKTDKDKAWILQGLSENQAVIIN